MTILNFPTGASTGTVYTGTNSVVYTFDGVKWNGNASTGGSLTGWNVTTGNHLIPATDNLQDIGTPTARVRHLYVGPGSITVGNAVISESATGKLVLPGVTRATALYADEVEDTEDQTYSFSSTPIVVDAYEYSILAGATPDSTYVAAEYLVDGIDGEGFIDGITVDVAGTWTQAIADYNRSNGMYAYIGADINEAFNANNWMQIPFVVRAKADDIEYESDLGGGGNTLTNLVLTNHAIQYSSYAEPLVSFTKENYATGNDATDEIDTNLAIKRDDDRGIYNPYLEPGYDNTNLDGPSPAGTLWNNDGWGDLTNLNQRRYFSFYDVFESVGNNVRTANPVMKDVDNDKYYKFVFTVWGSQNAGAPVTYTRTQIDPVTGATIGDPVTFVKLGYDDPTVVNDPIDIDLTLARSATRALYNIALESSNGSVGDGENSPEGTLWNADGWTNLFNVKTRTYETLMIAVDGDLGNNLPDAKLVMWDTQNDKYYAVRFTNWTQSGNGGGFSYTRQLINDTYVFIKPNNDTDTIDEIVPGEIGITRGYDGGIYNPYDEGNWQDTVSPGGTLWNRSGWNELSDLTTRNYQPFFATFGSGGLGNKVIGTELVMYVPSTEEYYAIKFLSWTQGSNSGGVGGGGFSYTRFLIDTTQINEGVEFADGTHQITAYVPTSVKSTAPVNRRIEEWNGYHEVTLTTATYSTSTSETVYQSVSSNDYLQLTETQNLLDIYNSYGNVTNNNQLTVQLSLNNGTTWIDGFLNGAWGGHNVTIRLFRDIVTLTQGQSVLFRKVTGGEPQVWFDPENSPGGSDNFRGAVIDYHAYSQSDGTIVGQIMIANDWNRINVTHSENTNGSDNLPIIDLWYRNNQFNQGQIAAKRLDGVYDTIKIQWTANIFYGSEGWD